MNDHEKLEKVYVAMFGDGNGDVGMHAKVNSMYELFSGSSLAGKFIKNFIFALAALATAGYVIWKVATGHSPF